MSSIDRDALIAVAMEELKRWGDPEYDSDAHMAVTAILPAVEQAIRAAEQRGREQAAQAIERLSSISGSGKAWLSLCMDVARGEDPLAAELARGGSTDEEQTP